MTDLLRDLARQLRYYLRGPSFQAVLERELQQGDSVRLRVSTIERSLGRSNDLQAGSESPAASRTLRTKLERG